ncbi:hypothetical protein [Actinacidiphila alni]|uniref:hypothetical protein n=1 Tax=Actinacidiphila alni TaxID=380248 RepID=UPI001FE82BEF|nr:hypothetical protein [Actinacidiphila alni]
MWSRQGSVTGLTRAAEEVVETAKMLASDEVYLPWIDDNPETKKFIEFWFAEPQRGELRRIAYVLNQMDGCFADPLRLALSRIIITKKRGASLAHDVSHSRPHRVGITNDFLVSEGFCKAAMQIERRLKGEVDSSAHVRLGDARSMSFIAPQSIDLVVTSPPYLNAIDYLRGHRMALVWLGHRIDSLRQIRGSSVGAEKALKEDPKGVYSLVQDTDVDSLSPRTLGILHRYARDMLEVASELHRVLRPESPAVLVVGNSTVRGTFVDNASVVRRASEQMGFATHDISERELPTNRRYLPPPSAAGAALDLRMRKEVVLTMRKI